MSGEESPFRSGILKQSVALITGGGSGIGLEITRQLGLHGSRVVVMGRREEAIQAALKTLRAEGIDADGFRGDVRKFEDCERVVQSTVQKYGALTILVNCAAGNFLSTAEDMSPGGFKTVMEIDALGTFNASKASHKYLKESKNGLIINISATLHYGASWYQLHASAAKAAIDSMTRTLGLEWGVDKIRVVGIAPGPIADTAGMAKLSGNSSFDQISKFIPLGRMGTKWDIAMCVVYLSSAAGRFITGETIVVDGAHWMMKPPPVDRKSVQQWARGAEKKSRETGLAVGPSKL